MRSGTHALSQLAVPLNVHVMRALDEEPMPLPDLRAAVGHPPATTMRSYLRNLTKLGVVERHRQDDFPGSVSYAITGRGEDLLVVADGLQRWLAAAPCGPIELGSTASRSAIKALVDGWSAGIIRALAATPLALTELDRLIPHLSYPALERRLTAMRQVGLVGPEPQRNGRVTRCRVTEWLRQAIAPLAAAVNWEYRCLSEASGPGRLDVEALFLLSAPQLKLPADLSGTCRLAAEFQCGSGLEFAGVMVEVDAGEVRSCVARLDGNADAWATGPAAVWFRRFAGAGEGQIDIGGESTLARALEDGLRRDHLAVG